MEDLAALFEDFLVKCFQLLGMGRDKLTGVRKSGDDGVEVSVQLGLVIVVLRLSFWVQVMLAA